jgi:hypothetical protein
MVYDMITKTSLFLFRWLFATVFLVFGSSAVYAQTDIQLDFGGAITGQPGETVTIEVKTSDLTGLDVFNFDFRFAFDTDLIEFTSGNIVADNLTGSFTKNVTPDNRILVSYAFSEPIERGGTLFTMTGTLKGDGSNNSGVTITEIIMGDGTLNVSPSVPHTIPVQVSGEPGQIDLVFEGSLSGTAGDQVTLNVLSSDLTGLDVSNFDFRFSFDSDLIQFNATDIITENLTGSFTKNVTPDNRILVSYASSEPIHGSGLLLTMTGTLTGDGSNNSGVTVTEIIIGDGTLNVSPSVPHPIPVQVTAVPISWAVTPDNLELGTSDAAQIDINVEQLTGSTVLEWNAGTTADWLIPDGLTSGSGNGSFRYNVIENTGSELRNATIMVSSNAGSKTVAVNQPGRQATTSIDLDFGEAISTVVGNEIELIIRTSDLTGLGITNFDFGFSYDSNLLVFDRSGILAGELVSSVTGNVTSDARILVSFAASSPIVGAGELFRLRGKAKSIGSKSDGLRVDEVLMGDGSVNINPSVPHGISVSIEEGFLWVSTESILYDADGGNKTMTINTNANWSFDSVLADWLSINPESGSGNSAVTITASSNPSDQPRSTVISVSGGGITREISIEQAATTWLTLSSNELIIPREGTALYVDVSSNVDWSVSKVGDWINVTPTSGSNDGELTVSAIVNTSTSSRTGSVTVSGGGLTRTMTVTQEGAVSLTTSVSSLSFGDVQIGQSSAEQSYTVSGSNLTGNVIIEAPEHFQIAQPGGVWTSSLTLSPSGGSISQAVRVRFSPGSIGNKSGDISHTSLGQTRTVEVSGNATPVPSVLDVTPTSMDFTHPGGSLNATVNSNVSWTASASSNWISVSPGIGNGNATLNVTVTENTQSEVRSGVVVVSGGGMTRYIQVSQGSAPLLTVSPVNVVLSQQGTGLPLQISSNIDWQVSKDRDWIIVSTASGSGNGEITVSATVNTSSDSRTGSVTVSSDGLTRIVTVTQEGSVSLTTSVSSLSFGNVEVGQYSEEQSYTVSGSNLTTQVSIMAPEHFQISLPEGSWASSFTLSPSEGSISQTVRVRFSPGNTGNKLGDITHTSSGQSRTVQVSGNATDTLPAPVQLSPLDKSEDVSPQVVFDWSPVNGAEYYILHASANNPVEMVIDVEVTGNSYSVPEPLDPNRDYYWRVRGVRGGEPGLWSPIWSFKTMAEDILPGIVVLLSPADGAVVSTKEVALNWQAAEHASSYQLEVDPGQGSPVQEYVSENTGYVLTDLDIGRSYSWRVRGVNKSGSGPWSESRDFITEPLPAPIQLSPSDKSRGVSLELEFDWLPVDGAEYYILHASANNPVEMVIDVEVTGSSYTVPEPMDPNRDYYWRVRAVRDNEPGLWSPIWSFTTLNEDDPDPLPGEVVLLSPGDGAEVSSEEVVLSWQAAEYASSYHLEVNPGQFSPVLEYASEDTGYVLVDLDAGRSYSWRVRGVNDTGHGPWSEWSTFTTDIDPLPDADILISLTFSDSDGSQKIVLGMDKTATDGFNTEFDRKAPPLDPGTNFDVRIREAGEEFSRYFRAYTTQKVSYRIAYRINSGTLRVGWSAEDLPVNGHVYLNHGARQVDLRKGQSHMFEEMTSGSGEIELVIELLPVVELIYPPDDEEEMEHEIEFIWKKRELADSYHFQLSDDIFFSNITHDITNHADTVLKIANLGELKSYFWRIRTVNSYGFGDWSSVRSFETKIGTSLSDPDHIPVTFRLEQNYPNPFNPTTNIVFHLPEQSVVKLEVYNILGHLVARLADNVMPAGVHTIQFDATGLPSGTYLYRLSTPVFSEIRKLVLIK